jgi:hypothetical protein
VTELEKFEATMKALAELPEDVHEKPYEDDEANAYLGVWKASRREALEEAASAALNASLDSIWADGRLMDAREVGSACAAAIRKLATETNNG